MAKPLEDSEQLYEDKIQGLSFNNLGDAAQLADDLTKIKNHDSNSVHRHTLQESLAKLRGRGKGEQLVGKLLQSRRDENIL